jgi:hypothetical protein
MERRRERAEEFKKRRISFFIFLKHLTAEKKKKKIDLKEKVLDEQIF